jgi:CBS domain-containing protein
MNVARILKDKGRNVTTAHPDTKMRDVVNILYEKRIGAIVVCENFHNVRGIITERDIVRLLALYGPAALDAPVSQHMTKNVKTCTERDTVIWLMEEMTRRRFRHLPVLEGDKLVGIISIGDVVKVRVAEVELEAASMREYITTG